jgi:hypothetical protein
MVVISDMKKCKLWKFKRALKGILKKLKINTTIKIKV